MTDPGLAWLRPSVATDILRFALDGAFPCRTPVYRTPDRALPTLPPRQSTAPPQYQADAGESATQRAWPVPSPGQDHRKTAARWARPASLRRSPAILRGRWFDSTRANHRRWPSPLAVF